VKLESGQLDVVGFLEGTFKSTRWVNILRHYERHFAEYKDQEIEILEIGVNRGASMRIWKQFFSKARFVGVDIDPLCAQYADDRVTVEIGSQEDPEFLASLIRKYSPSIIIDDGSHTHDHIMFSFERLYPMLPPGGMYVIEDLFYHFRPQPNRYLGPTKETSTEFLCSLVKLMFTERPVGSATHGMLAHLKETIDEISFAPLGVAFLRKAKKKANDAEKNELFSFAERYAEESDDHQKWIAVSEYIRHHRGDLARAENAVRKAIGMEPTSGPAYHELTAVLEARNDAAAAAAAAEKAIEHGPDNWENWFDHGRLLGSLGQYAKAEESLRRAAEMRRINPVIKRRLNEVLIAQGKPAEPE
jgi:hypothetical protein